MTLADQILAFNKSLSLTASLPAGVEVMNPFQEPATFELCRKFYHQFYADDRPRKIILGINPGRLGGGATGIPFTDPMKLEKFCNIPNELPKKTELSSDFIYTLIETYGGPKAFYQEFIFSSVCPLGFTKDGINMNYYDDKNLERAVREFIIESIQAQLNFPVDREVCFCLGEGLNYKYLSKLNTEYSFFKKIIPLPHPRFIMQYRRKKIAEFVNIYIQRLKAPA
jgi:hypothetical protein